MTAGLFLLAILFVPVIALVGQCLPYGGEDSIPLTFSIAAGIGLGVLGYVLVMVATARARAVHPLMWLIALLFVGFFASDWLSANVF